MRTFIPLFKFAILLMTKPMSKKKLASSLPLSFMLGAAAWTFICPPAPFAERVCAQTVSSKTVGNEQSTTLDSEFAVASNFYAQKQWELAAGAFQTYIEKRGATQQTAAAKFFLGECYIQQNDFESAYPWYEQFVRDNPRNELAARATFRMGESAWRTGQHENALQILERFTQAHPTDDLIEFALPYLGQLRLQRSEPQLASAAFTMALKLFPNSSLAIENQMGLGTAFQALGDLGNATAHYKIVAGSSEESHKTLVGQAKLKLGIVAFQQRDYPQAVALLGDALKTCSGEAKIDCGYWLARSEMAVGNHSAAVELVSGLLTTFSKSPMPESTGSILLFDGAVSATEIDRDELACIWLAKLQRLYPANRLVEKAFDLEIRLHQQAGRHERVIAMYEGLLKDLPTGTASTARLISATELAGRVFYSRGDYARTVETYHGLLKTTAPDGDEQITPQLRDQRATWLYLQSLGHLGLEQYDEALKELELADAYNQSDSMSALISLARATALFGQQQYSRAVEHYHEYLLTSSDGDDVMRAGCELALCYAELKQWDDTLNAFEIIQDFPAHEMITETTQYLAEKAYDANEKSVAETLYSAMTDPGNPQAVITRGLSGLAWVNMESTDNAKALSVFKRLIEDYPDSRFSRNAAMSRAKFLDEAGFEAEASEMYSLVIDRFGRSDEASAARLRKVALLQAVGGRSNLELARDLLKEQLQQQGSSSDDETLYQLAWVLMDLGKTDDGMDRFNRLVQQYPESKYWSDAAFRIATRHVSAGEVEAANRMADEILKKNAAAATAAKTASAPAPSPASDTIIGRTILLKSQLAAAAHDWPEVTRLMKQVKENTSNSSTDVANSGSSASINSKATYWLAESLYQQEHYNKSSQEFAAILDDTMLATDLQPWVRLRLAQCLGKLERWEDAANVAEDGMALFSDFSHAYEFTFVKARGLETRGMLNDAQELYTAVIESESGRGSETAAIAQWRIGEIHFHREDYQAAIASYQKVDALYGYAQWRKAAILQAGKCQEHLGNWKHAVKLYSQLIAKFPESEMAAQAQARLVLIERLAKQPSPPSVNPNAQPKRR